MNFEKPLVNHSAFNYNEQEVFGKGVMYDEKP